MLSLIIIRSGENEIDGLTNVINNVSYLPRTERKLKAMFDFPNGENVVRYIKNELRAECTDLKKVPKIRHNGRRLLKKAASKN